MRSSTGEHGKEGLPAARGAAESKDRPFRRAGGRPEPWVLGRKVET